MGQSVFRFWSYSLPLAAALCVQCKKPAPAPTATQASAGAPAAATAAASGPAAAPPAPAVAKSLCSAVTKGSFHLRPKAQRKSAGPEFPKGTQLAVLARLPPPEKGDHRPIYQVQVKAGAQIGYAYLRHSELGEGCPMIWPGEEELKAGEPVKAPDEETCIKPGIAKSIAKVFTKECGAPDKDSGEKVDLNGDGRPDLALVTNEELVVVLSAPGGYRGVTLEPTEGRGSKIYDVDAVVRAGAASYIVAHQANWENETGDDGEIEQFGHSTVSVYRLVGDQFYRVFIYESGDHNETCHYEGRPDESFELRCDGGTAQLRWDASAKVLRPSLNK